MEVITAKTAGFCFGVKRAVEAVYQQIGKKEKRQIYTYGPIIHNREVVQELEKQGVKLLQSEEALERLSEGIVVIRSHGVGKGILDRLQEKNIQVVDATCPFVKKIHQIVEEKSREGAHIVIAGNPAHPEVIGIQGWVTGKAYVVERAEEVDRLPFSDGDTVCVVAQTTFNYNKFQELVEIFTKKSYDICVLNTICNATRKRQAEAERIAAEVDVMIVIGDRESSNTQKLFEICQNVCNDTYYVQTLDDLNLNQLESVETVGITAGASTPDYLIEEVQNNVRVIF